MKKRRAPFPWTTLRGLLSFLRPHRGWVALCVLTSIASALANVAGGTLIRTITDLALQNRPGEVLGMSLVVLGVVAVGIAASYVVQYSSGRFGANAIMDLRGAAADAVLRMSSRDIEASHSGEMVSRLTNDTLVIQSFYQDQFAHFLFHPIAFLAACLYLAGLNTGLFAWAMVIVPITVFSSRFVARPVGGYKARIQEGLAAMDAAIQDTIGGIAMLKAFNLSRTLFARFESAVLQVRDSSLLMQRRGSFGAAVNVVVGTLPMLSTAGLGGYLAVTGKMTPGGLFAFVYLLRYLINPLGMVPELLMELRGVLAATDRVLAVVRRPGERTDGSSFTVRPDGPGLEPALDCSELSFSYDGRNEVLRDLSFRVPQGRTTALVGHSGSGKSTVLKLLCGLHEPRGGKVRMFGHDLREWSLQALRGRLALVSQDTYLFPASIAENIRYGRPGATREEVTEAARAANAEEFILLLPDGYDTPVGERGNRLSGGQRQRIGIARALLKNAPILLLDEPTSALDAHSEALVQKALERVMRGRTVLVIAHRLSTIQGADEVLVLDGGRIMERGTHEELLRSGGMYKELYLKQVRSGAS